PVCRMHPEEAGEFRNGGGHIAGSAVPRPPVELVDTVEVARRPRHVDLPPGAIVRQLTHERLPHNPDLLMPLPGLDYLLRRERDQHANDDDPDLANERAPAVQRLG